MADDRGPLRTEQGNAPTHGAVLNVATILDILAAVLGMYHAVLDLANAFISTPLAT